MIIPECTCNTHALTEALSGINRDLDRAVQMQVFSTLLLCLAIYYVTFHMRQNLNAELAATRLLAEMYLR